MSSILAKLDFLEEIIASLSEEIDRVIAPFEDYLELIDTIPGVDRRVGEALIAEVGVDMSVFGAPDRLRLSFGAEDEVVVEAARRIRAAC